MIGGLILIAAQAAQPALAEGEPIVVIGRRLDKVAVSVGQGPDGKWYCGMDGSSGVPSLDSRVCKAVTKCVRKGAITDEAVRGCITKSKRRLFDKFKREQERNR